MPRTARVFQRSVCYHVMNRGVNRQDIFFDDTDHQRFVELAAEYKARFGVKVYHWVLMSNHYHLLIEAAYSNLRPFVGGLQQVYAQYHHARHQSSGVFWQGRFKSKPVEIGDYLVKGGRYIERNPVRAGMAGAAWDYRWSSARFYVQGEPDGLTDFNSHLGEMTDRDRRSYGEILISGAEDNWVLNCQKHRVIGSNEFASRFRIEQGRSRLKRGRPACNSSEIV